MQQNQSLKKVQSTELDALKATFEIRKSLQEVDLAGVVFFASSHYDLASLAAAMKQQFTCPVIGCTSAGEICSTFAKNSLIALGFSKEAFTFYTGLIKEGKTFTPIQAKAMIEEITSTIPGHALNPTTMFCFLLNNGLSMQEESVTSVLYHALGGISLFGGSAGDDLSFTNAPVYYEGAFYPSGAVFALIETNLDFEIIKIQHYEPSSQDMVVTKADPNKRLVYEIDGESATEALSKLTDISEKELAVKTYSTHPVMLPAGNEWYVRSIKEVHKDGSISFYCAIDTGLPLTIGHGKSMVETLETAVAGILKEFKTVEITLGCDCILRRIEMEEKGLQKDVESQLQRINFFGFSTYGEQLNAIHINQTLTGIVLGEKY